MNPPRTGFAGPLKGAPLAARPSRFRGGRLIGANERLHRNKRHPIKDALTCD